MLLEIKVKPGSSKDNESLCQFLGNLFKISKREIKILKGTTSRNKIVKIEGITEEKAIKIIKEILNLK
jgi:uncharacterized protein YggU (UPF0235/DUF167 family)